MTENTIFNTLLQNALITIVFFVLNKFNINRIIDKEGNVNNEANMMNVEASLFLVKK